MQSSLLSVLDEGASVGAATKPKSTKMQRNGVFRVEKKIDVGKLGDGEARLSFRCHVSQSRSGSFHCRFHLTVGCPLRLAILNS